MVLVKKLMFAMLCMASLGRAAVPKDEVKAANLPGLNATEIPGIEKMYSGYIPTSHPNGTVMTHYWLFLSGPDKPTVAWHQGGPGGSSMIGLFTENGPLTLNDFSTQTAEFESTGIPSVFFNPNSWHLAGANMLYVEHPAPTGFSYCDPGPCYWNDTSQSETSVAFYEKFFSTGFYPELAKNRFLLTGESYAGVLVPTLAMRILEARKAVKDANVAPYNLEGFALGNDCPGNRVFTCTPYSGWLGTKVSVDFIYRHGMVSETFYAQLREACADFFAAPTFDPPASKQCRDLLEDPIRPCKSIAGDTYSMGGGYFLYDTCDYDLMALDDDGIPFAQKGKTSSVSSLVAETKKRATRSCKASSNEWHENAGEYACGQEKNSNAWLNLESVQKVIHVKPGVFSFSTGLNYSFTLHSIVDEYKTTLLKHYRVLQYSGDADPCGKDDCIFFPS